jgi:hypothetical protein
MDVGLKSTMPKTPEFNELLFHSKLVSFISFEVSQLAGVKKAVSVSTIGLLHDIGKSIVLLLKAKQPKMGVLIDTLDQAKLGALLLGLWNIPDVVCRTLEYQEYPKWLPPELIPKERRQHVTILYIAHLCYEYLQGKTEKELSTAFLGDYLSVINRPEKSIAEFVQRMILPALRKKLRSFPEDVRDFLTAGEKITAGEKTEDIAAS